jgi:hypothetical protein
MSPEGSGGRRRTSTPTAIDLDAAASEVGGIANALERPVRLVAEPLITKAQGGRASPLPTERRGQQVSLGLCSRRLSRAGGTWLAALRSRNSRILTVTGRRSGNAEAAAVLTLSTAVSHFYPPPQRVLRAFRGDPRSRRSRSSSSGRIHTHAQAKQTDSPFPCRAVSRCRGVSDRSFGSSNGIWACIGLRRAISSCGRARACCF